MRSFVGAMALLASMSVPVAADAALTTLSNLFVFGDSLSDSGNSGVVSSGTFTPPPYYNNQFSNGPVAVEQLWSSFNPGNTNFKPSLAGGTNYAIGGATSGDANYLSVRPDLPPALQALYAHHGNAWQLQTYSSQLLGGRTFDPATSLFVVWLFPNDVYYYGATGGSLPGVVPGSPGGPDLVSNGIANILTTVQTLALSGATHFLVPNMPDLGATPSGLGDPGLTLLSKTFNDNLATQLTLLGKALPSVDITQFDTFRTLNKIIADPVPYGFTNVTDACVAHLADGACTPDSWLFWDGVHPTTKADSILAADFRAAVVPEPGSWVLMAGGLVLLCVMSRQRAAL
jgi:phospholipase/lecithinase/hemolysin